MDSPDISPALYPVELPEGNISVPVKIVQRNGAQTVVVVVVVVFMSF
jgi:hypothetical protein